MEAINRSERRLKEKKRKNRALAALSIVAGSSLFSGYLVYVRGVSAYAAPACPDPRPERAFGLNLNLFLEPSPALRELDEAAIGAAISSQVDANSCDNLVVTFTGDASSTYFLDGDIPVVTSIAEDDSVLELHFDSSFTLEGTAGVGGITFSSAEGSTSPYFIEQLYVTELNLKNGTGVSLTDVTAAAFINSTFDGNKKTSGGAISTDGLLAVAFSTLVENQATTGSGGALSAPEIISLSNTFYLNSAAIGGGAIHIQDSAAEGTILYNTFLDNTAASSGESLKFSSSTGELRVDGNIFASSTLTSGQLSIDAGMTGPVRVRYNISTGEEDWDNAALWDPVGSWTREANLARVNLLDLKFDAATTPRSRLKDNGGPTKTIAIADESLAQDFLIPRTVPLPFNVDQRGLPRDSFIDAGAFEIQRTFICTSDLVLSFGDYLETPGSTLLDIDEETLGKVISLQLNACNTLDVNFSGELNETYFLDEEILIQNNLGNDSFLRLDFDSSTTLEGTSGLGGIAFSSAEGSGTSYLESLYVKDLNLTNSSGVSAYNVRQAVFLDSTFEGNKSEFGGAIYSNGTLIAIRNTFVGNQATAGNGGAIVAPYLVSLVNTFYQNTATGEGGAIFVEGGLSYNSIIESNTFLDNSAVVGNSIKFGNYNGSLSAAGNIFASSISSSISSAQEISIRSAVRGTVEVLYNISTGGEIWDDPTVWKPSDTLLPAWKSEGNRHSVSLSSLKFDAPGSRVKDNGGTTKTIAIARGSTAQNFVPASKAPYLFVTDQRGLARDSLFDAGSFEIQSASGGDSMGPTVLTVNPKKITLSGEIVTVFGAVLSGVTQITVGGLNAEIIAAKPNSITFVTPKGLNGLQTLELTFASTKITLEDALNFLVSAKSKTKTIVSGFAPNSVKLTRTMKREIREFVRSNPDLTTVVCKGYTSAPSTIFDSALARKRGNVVCDYVKKKFPAIKVEVREGQHTNAPGSNVRRVRLIML